MPPQPTQIINDDLGRPFPLPARTPERIVSMAPNVTEILFALGLGGRVVGVTRFCDWPPEAKAIPKIGGLIDPNIEVIRSLDPDLVIAFRGNPLRLVDRVRKLGLPVFVLDIGEGLDDLFPLIEQDRPGHADGRPGGRARRRPSKPGRGRRRAACGAPLSRPKVFALLYGQGLWTCGGESYLDDLIARAGGVNVASALPKKWALYKRERIIKDDPDVIFILARSAADFASGRDWLARTPGMDGRRGRPDRPDLRARRERGQPLRAEARRRPRPNGDPPSSRRARRAADEPEGAAAALLGGVACCSAWPVSWPLRPDRPRPDDPRRSHAASSRPPTASMRPSSSTSGCRGPSWPSSSAPPWPYRAPSSRATSAIPWPTPSWSASPRAASLGAVVGGGRRLRGRGLRLQRPRPAGLPLRAGHRLARLRPLAAAGRVQGRNHPPDRHRRRRAGLGPDLVPPVHALGLLRPGGLLAPRQLPAGRMAARRRRSPPGSFSAWPLRSGWPGTWTSWPWATKRPRPSAARSGGSARPFWPCRPFSRPSPWPSAASSASSASSSPIGSAS